MNRSTHRNYPNNIWLKYSVLACILFIFSVPSAVGTGPNEYNYAAENLINIVYASGQWIEVPTGTIRTIYN